MYQLKNVLLFLLYLVFNPKLIFFAIRGLHIPVFLQYIWLKEFKIGTFIDVGAYTGQVSKVIRFLFPDTTIYAFEPIASNFDQIKKNISTVNFSLEKVALSNKTGKSDFFINSYIPASSLLPINPKYKRLYPSLAPKKRIKVKTTTLDLYFKSKKINGLIFLKIDVQGAEELVLQGAGRLLNLVDILSVETAFDQLYQKQPYFAKIYELLKKKKFEYKGDIRETDFYPIFKLPRQQNSIFMRKGINVPGL